MKHNPLKKTTLGLLLAASLMFATVMTAAAQEVVDACEGDAVTGTVVATDTNSNVLTVWTGDSLCTLDLGGEFDATVESLLGVYFDGLSFDLLNGALEPANWALTYDALAGTWSVAEEGDETTEVVIAAIEDNGDGSYTVTFFGPDSDEPQTLVIDDPELAAELMDGMAGVALDLAIAYDEDGSLTLGENSILIAELHDEGMGFGVMVKLFSVAQENDVAVQTLIDAFNDGMGLGQIYAEYGYPAHHGVGHIFQELGENPGNGNGNGGGNGNGNGNGWGKPGDNPDHPGNKNGKKP